MKRNALLVLAILTAAGLSAGRADAASAVAMDDHGHLVHSKGQRTREIAIYNTLEGARQLYGADANVKLIASSDVTGYCAIAVAGNPKGGWLVAAALGQRTQTEADSLATGQCIKGGGVNPQVRWRWHG